MIFSFVKRLFAFLLLILVQGFFLNQVNVMGYATPMVFIFFLLVFQRGSSRFSLLLWGFFLGLAMDLFTNTPGVGAASCTLLGMIQPLLLEMFLPRDCAEDLSPSIKEQGLAKFCGYLLLSTFIFYVVYYLLLAFSLAHLESLAINIIGGTLFSFVLMLGLNSLYHRS
ncbi:MAG: rod shape-determining protein MreD [Bacteroidaceae bacterium]|jgi:rod shape-determining protein MreD|nr:rod shape-determining protein MreD [Bacteroidaceae bacterium]MBR6988683.1 rod shape-determining protein MreD [Bacteroidaceae bacterium]